MKSRDMLRDLIATYWQQVKEAPLQGRRVAWCSGISPIDLLKVMDFTLVFPENYAATCSARKVSTMFCERAESFGYSPDICSYARNGLGSVLSGDVEHCPVGGLPRPDLLLINSYCAPITKWFEELSRFFKVPLIIVEQAFPPRQFESARERGIGAPRYAAAKGYCGFSGGIHRKTL